MSIRGRQFVLTGKMTRSRSDMVQAIREAGGYLSGNVSVAGTGGKVDYNTDYVVVGGRVGSVKLNGAAALNKPFITENDLWRMIREDDFRPVAMTQTDAVLYSSTIGTTGVPTRPFVSAAQAAGQQAASVPLPVSENRVVNVEDVDLFSIADFFEE